MFQVLVLNNEFRPVQTISWKRAIQLVFKEKAEILKYSNEKVRTPTTEYFIPAIIRIVKMLRRIYKRYIPLSKKNILTRDNHTCQYCGSKPGKSITIDHIIPISRGGKDEWENLVACCLKCNNDKNNKLPSEVGMTLSKTPKKPTVFEFLHYKLKSQGFDEVLNEFMNEEFS